MENFVAKGKPSCYSPTFEMPNACYVPPKETNKKPQPNSYRMGFYNMYLFGLSLSMHFFTFINIEFLIIFTAGHPLPLYFASSNSNFIWCIVNIVLYRTITAALLPVFFLLLSLAENVIIFA